MKKLLAVLLSALMVSSTFAVSAFELETPEQNNEFVKTETAAPLSEAPALVPGVNIFTGTDAIVDFSDSGVRDGIVMANDWGLVPKTANGTYLRLTNTHTDALVGVTATMPFGFDADRPLAFFVSAFYNGSWGSASIGSVTDTFSSVGSGEYGDKEIIGNNAAAGETVNALVIGFGAYPGCAADIMEVAVVPYYKATYHFSDGTTEEKYFLSADGNIGVSYGKITGIADSYSIDTTIVDADAGDAFLGWAPAANASAAFSSVALEGKDIDLYPVLISPGVNVLTGTDDVFDFSAEGALDRIALANDYGLVPKSASGKALCLTNTHSDPLVGVTGTISFGASVDRPVAFFADAYYSGSWGSVAVGDTSVPFSTVGGGGTDSVKVVGNNAENPASVNSVVLGFGAYSGCYAQYSNLAVVPYYKATYHFADGTSESEYFLSDDGNISVSGGKVTGIAATFTVDPTVVDDTTDGTFLGWATAKNAAAAVSSVALDGSDVNLYPVFLTPGVNLFTGTDDVLDFSDAAVRDAVKLGNDFGVVPKTASGKALRLTNSHSDALVGVTATLPFGASLDRPVAFFADVYYSGAWGSVTAGGTTVDFSTVGGGATNSESVKGNNAASPAAASNIVLGFGAYSGCYAEYSNLAVVPYYKVTYHFSDNTTKTEYFLSADGNINVSGGKVTGIAASYTVDPTVTDTSDDTLLGWATTEGAAAAMSSVALEGKDIDLYPVFLTPGVNLFTGTDAVVDFSAEGALDAVVLGKDYGVIAKTANGNAMHLTNNHSDPIDGVTATMSFGTALDRPVAFFVGTSYNASWGSAAVGNASAAFSTYGGGSMGSLNLIGNNASDTEPASALVMKFGAYSGCAADYRNVAVVPYFKATYHFSDNTTEDVFFLSENGNIGVSSGKVTGIATTYTVDTAKTDDTATGTFLGWASSADATAPETTITLNGADIDLYPVFEPDPVELIFKTSVRTADKPGIRFVAYINEDNRAIADEYGFITAISNATLEAHPEYLTHNASLDAKGVNANGIRYTTGINYDKAKGTDLVYATSGEDFGDAREGYFFTGVLINISASNYKTNFVTRPYLRIGDTVAYGASITRNLYDAATAVKNAGYTGLDDDEKAYIDGILAD